MGTYGDQISRNFKTDPDPGTPDDSLDQGTSDTDPDLGTSIQFGSVMLPIPDLDPLPDCVCCRCLPEKEEHKDIPGMVHGTCECSHFTTSVYNPTWPCYSGTL